MEEAFISEDVRKRLVLAGLRELSDFGMRDFSLRRVAIAAGVSCAAPYRHFKDKDELISSIIEYVKDGWELLSGEIMNTHGRGSPESIVEISVMLVRFWLGNKSIMSMLLLSGDDGSGEVWRDKLKSFCDPLISCIGSFSILKGLSDESRAIFEMTLLTLIYGSLTVIASGVYAADEVVSNLRNKIIFEIINML